MKVKLLSRVQLLATPWTAAHQAPPSMGPSRQEYAVVCICRSQSYNLCYVYYHSQLRRRQWHPTPVLLPGKSHGWRSLVGCVVHGVTKSRTRLSSFTFTFHFHALEKEMATRSSVRAWRIPGMGEPGGLPSMGSHRVGHD